MRVYVIEYKTNKSFISRAISKITKQNYSHSAMFFDKTFYELDGTNEYKDEPDYHSKKYDSIQEFLLSNPENNITEAYMIPEEFTEEQIKKGHAWWQNKKDKIYGYTKLLTFLLYIPLRPFMKLYYKRKGIPYSPKLSSKNSDVCSVAVDQCTKNMGYDIFPEFDERIIYPGLYAQKLKGYKV